MKYKENWMETRERFELWWQGKNAGRPLISVITPKEQQMEELEPEISSENPEDYHLNVENNIRRYRNYCKTHNFMAEAFPNFNINIGAGSMALYLGCEPNFAWDTIWFRECVRDWNEFGPLKFDPDNYWWKKHLDLLRKARELAGNDFLVTIPDIVENLDILSAMRGPQNFIYDLMDEPEKIKDYVNQVDELYFKYYDPMYNIVKDNDGSCSYTAFDIWGEGKTAKIQCDICALLSPDQFREFVQPSLRKQCQKLDHSIYHLDGPDAIKHVDALMEIKELNALQWTNGAGQPDGGSERWYPIYDKVVAAEKSLWIALSDGTLNDCMENAKKLVKRYGPERLYLLFPQMDVQTAEDFIRKADRYCWKKGDCRI